MTPVTLTTQGTAPGAIMRPWAESDADDTMIEACNDPLIARFLPLMPHPYTARDATWWVTEGAAAVWAAGGAAFTIRDRGTGELLGGIGISSRHKYRGQAELGYWIAPWARSRGVATAAAKTVAAWAFTDGIERLELLVAKENPGSMRVALGAGFAMEGVRRGASPTRDSDRRDLVAFARLAADAAEPVRRNLPDLPAGRLTDGVVTLRRLAVSDVDDYLALNELPEVRAHHFSESITPLTAVTRCERAEYGWLAGEAAQLVVLDAATGAFAGEISFHYRWAFTRQGMIGYALRPEFRGRGFATRAAKLLTDWAFEHVGAIRVVAGTTPDNETSQRVLTRAGFQREAYLKSALPGHDGGRIDDIQFVRISPSFHPPSAPEGHEPGTAPPQGRLCDRRDR